MEGEAGLFAPDNYYGVASEWYYNESYKDDLLWNKGKNIINLVTCPIS